MLRRVPSGDGEPSKTTRRMRIIRGDEDTEEKTPENAENDSDAF